MMVAENHGRKRHTIKTRAARRGALIQVHGTWGLQSASKRPGEEQGRGEGEGGGRAGGRARQTMTCTWIKTIPTYSFAPLAGWFLLIAATERTPASPAMPMHMPHDMLVRLKRKGSGKVYASHRLSAKDRGKMDMSERREVGIPAGDSGEEVGEAGVHRIV